ncbi:hypothetical protein OWP19_23685 [Bacillus cereus]|uniref:hypothetical protein n=1 Tax=Bacillus cereus TaxID=1396 RepID=UPI00254E2DB6|nr:hypothetical protein [Bacillus cereus]MDK7480972.1 hypothetical protein [Bacillus cereus]
MKTLRVKQYVRYTTGGRKNTKAMCKKSYKHAVALYKDLNDGPTPTTNTIRTILTERGQLDKEFIWQSHHGHIHSNHPLVKWLKRFEESKQQ